jgi:hypothetical protein
MKQLMMGGALALAALGAAPAQAVSYTVDLTGNVADFQPSNFDFFGLHFERYYLPLSGLDASNAITVEQGDSIFATVALDASVTVALSEVRTDLLHFYFGSGFTGGTTAMSGTFNFYDGATLVNSFTYGSSTSYQLAAFAAVFPPLNGAFTFDSYTNDMLIQTLDAPARLNASAFMYDLVSGAVPEPASWAMMVGGFAVIGTALRRGRKALAA